MAAVSLTPNPPVALVTLLGTFREIKSGLPGKKTHYRTQEKRRRKTTRLPLSNPTPPPRYPSTSAPRTSSRAVLNQKNLCPDVTLAKADGGPGAVGGFGVVSGWMGEVLGVVTLRNRTDVAGDRQRTFVRTRWRKTSNTGPTDAKYKYNNFIYVVQLRIYVQCSKD